MRTDILERKEEILQWINEGQSKAQICRNLQCKPDTLERYLGIMDIKYSGNIGNKGFFKINSSYISAQEYIKKDYVSSSRLRQKLIIDGLKEEKCERCGLNTWLDEPLNLELHHIDGNHYNNDFSNLQILCPNCHSLTQNYRNNNISKKIKKCDTFSTKSTPLKTNKCCECGKLITDQAKMCQECYKKSIRKVEWPDRDVLKNDIRTQSFLSLSSKYGVSDKAIVKWCIHYNLPSKKKDIKTYSDEEWALI